MRSMLPLPCTYILASTITLYTVEFIGNTRQIQFPSLHVNHIMAIVNKFQLEWERVHDYYSANATQRQLSQLFPDIVIISGKVRLTLLCFLQGMNFAAGVSTVWF